LNMVLICVLRDQSVLVVEAVRGEVSARVWRRPSPSEPLAEIRLQSPLCPITDGVACHERDGRVVLAGRGEDGAFVLCTSYEPYDTWTTTETSLRRPLSGAHLFSSDNHHLLLMGGEMGPVLNNMCYRSVDRGVNWKSTPAKHFLNNHHVECAYHIQSDHLVVVTYHSVFQRNAVFTSVDFGRSWVCVCRSTPFERRMNMSGAYIASSRRLLVIGGQGMKCLFSDVWVSTNDGRHWWCICPSGPLYAPRAYAMGTVVVMTGGQCVHTTRDTCGTWTSENGGATWSPLCPVDRRASPEWEDLHPSDLGTDTVAFCVSPAPVFECRQLIIHSMSIPPVLSRAFVSGRGLRADVEDALQGFQRLREVVQRAGIARTWYGALRTCMEEYVEMSRERELEPFLLRGLIMLCCTDALHALEMREFVMSEWIPFLIRLPEAQMRALCDCWSDACSSQISVLLRSLHMLLDACFDRPIDRTNVLTWMEVLVEANERCERVPWSAFHHEALSADLHRAATLLRRHPFVLTSACKWTLMNAQMRPSFVLEVRRDTMVDDCVRMWCSHRDDIDWGESLRISFEGEMAADAGGVRREFFGCFMSHLLAPACGLFEEGGDSGLYVLRPCASADSAMVRKAYAFGCLMGLACRNGVVVDAPCSSAVYRACSVESIAPTWRELLEWNRSLHDGLRSLLQDDASVLEDAFCMAFVVQDGANEVELCSGGREKMVTQANKHEYIERVMQYWLRDRSWCAWIAIRDGFQRMCSTRCMRSSEWADLMICEATLRMEELQGNARYEAPYHRDHAVVRMLWAVMAGWATAQKRRFLQFVTGNDRPPVGGLREMSLRIACDHNESHLPSASTCFHRLTLPMYATEDRMREAFDIALHWSSGFGLV
jgi:hypothetical protein